MAGLGDISIKKLYGVGEVRAAAYAKMGIYTVEDLIFCFPRAYENRGDICLLAEARNDIKSAVVLTVATQPGGVRVRRGPSHEYSVWYETSSRAAASFRLPWKSFWTACSNIRRAESMSFIQK